MNKRRLLKLADLLEADAIKADGCKFDLGGWGYSDDEQPVSHSCGTTACAVGLAVLSGAFEEDGLFNSAGEFAREVDPGFKDMIGWEATEEFFGLTGTQSSFLFLKGSYHGKTPTQGADGERAVAQRIRDFVAGKVHA